MDIHIRIIIRKRLKEINMAFDIRQHFNSRFYHGSNLLQIQLLSDCLPDIRLSHLVEAFEVHGLNIFSVHPF